MSEGLGRTRAALALLLAKLAVIARIATMADFCHSPSLRLWGLAANRTAIPPCPWLRSLGPVVQTTRPARRQQGRRAYIQAIRIWRFAQVWCQAQVLHEWATLRATQCSNQREVPNLLPKARTKGTAMSLMALGEIRLECACSPGDMCLAEAWTSGGMSPAGHWLCAA